VKRRPPLADVEALALAVVRDLTRENIWAVYFSARAVRNGAVERLRRLGVSLPLVEQPDRLRFPGDPMPRPPEPGLAAFRSALDRLVAQGVLDSAPRAGGRGARGYRLKVDP
jgi:hypothetical protein